MKRLILTVLFVLSSNILSSSIHAATISPIAPDQPPAGTDYAIAPVPIEDPRLFAGKKVAIFASHGVEESELVFPYRYLQERGAEVSILVPFWADSGITVSRFLRPILWATPDGTFRSAVEERYDLIVLTGGAWNAQVVKTDRDALDLLTMHARAGRPIAAICAGTEILITAGLARGTRLTGPEYARTNLANAGAIVEDRPSVVDRGILTSRDPYDLPSFVAGIRTMLVVW